MSKVKASGVPHYELLYIVSNNFSEDEVKPIAEKVEKIIADNGGTVTLKEEWGKKRFSYQVKSFYYGYYNLVEFDMPGENMVKTDKLLRMTSEVLRHQIVVKKIKSAKAIAEDKKIAEKIAIKFAKEDEDKNKQEEKVKEETIVKAKKKEKDSDKIDLKDLDDKLDKILETDNLL